MFAYRGIFLTATISSASIVLADIIVQPGYHTIPSYRNNPHDPRSQLLPQQQPSASRYYENQMTNPQLMEPMGATYPYHAYEGYRTRSHLDGYPIYHRSTMHHYLLPHQHSRPHHLIVKGGRGYVRPSLFVGYPQPLTVHHRFRRSSNFETTVNEAEQSALKHDDGVATKPSLTAGEQKPTVVDLSLLKNEPVDTNDKSTKNRRSKSDRARSFLFGLDPAKMLRNSRQVNPIKVKYSKGAPKPTPSEKSATQSLEIMAEPTKQTMTTTTTTTQVYVQEQPKQNDDSTSSTADPPREFTADRMPWPPIVFPGEQFKSKNPIALPSSELTGDTISWTPIVFHGEQYGDLKSPIVIPPSELSTDTIIPSPFVPQDKYNGKYGKDYVLLMPPYSPRRYESRNWPNSYDAAYELEGRDFPDPRGTRYSSRTSKAKSTLKKNAAPSQSLLSSQRSRGDEDETQSGSDDETIGAHNFLYDYTPYNAPSPRTCYSDGVYYVSPRQYYKYEPLDFAYPAGLDYATFKNGGSPDGLVVAKPLGASPLQMEQYPSSPYGCMTEHLTPTRNFYELDRASPPYESVAPLADTFSSAGYYHYY